MKLFGNFEAVRFPEEDLIFITLRGYIYYIYDPKYDHWRKYKNAGNDSITVSNYPDVDKEELKNALGGVFPTKETDIMRHCPPSGLWIRDMLALCMEDYPAYMSDRRIYDTVHQFLMESDIRYKSYLRLRDLFDKALALRQDKGKTLDQIKALCLEILGRDIFKKELGIVDGHDCSSYFWIRPVRIIDFSNTDDIDNVAEMGSAEISIEEDDVDQYLTPFLHKHFEPELEANKKRLGDHWIDGDGNEHTEYATGFERYLTHNFYTFDSVSMILEDIRDTIDAWSSGRENQFTAKLRKKRGTEIELIIDFYHRFIYRMEYMMKVGREKGYDLISFMGP